MHVLLLLGLAAAVAWGASQVTTSTTKPVPKPPKYGRLGKVDPRIHKALNAFWNQRVLQGHTVTRTEVQRYYDIAKKAGIYPELVDSLGRILRQLKETNMFKYQRVK